MPSWMSEKLQPIDLLSALQMKRSGGDDDDAWTRAMKREQLRAAQEANNMAFLKRDLLTPQYQNPLRESSYSTGMQEYKDEQIRTKLASLMQGLPAPHISGGGGGGGGGSSGMTGTQENAVNAAKVKGEEAQSQILTSQADLAGEQARGKRNERMGFTGGAKDILARQQMENDLAKAQTLNAGRTDIQGLKNEGALSVADVHNKGTLGAAEIGKEGRIGAAEVAASGRADLADTEGMKSERNSLYEASSRMGLTPDQLAEVEGKFPGLYEDSIKRGKPIPWGVILASIIKPKP